MTDQPIAHTADGQPLYDNTATVVGVLLSAAPETIVAIRRNTEPGKGKWALPAGYHMSGETWQEAGCREVLEETGYVVFPANVSLLSMETDTYGNNMVFGLYSGLIGQRRDSKYPDPAEIMEVKNMTLNDAIDAEWAFPLHKAAALNALVDF